MNPPSTIHRILFLLLLALATVLPARAWYDPGQGRWCSRDPIGEQDGVNLYGFVENNPADNIDVVGTKTMPARAPMVAPPPPPPPPAPRPMPSIPTPSPPRVPQVQPTIVVVPSQTPVSPNPPTTTVGPLPSQSGDTKCPPKDGTTNIRVHIMTLDGMDWGTSHEPTGLLTYWIKIGPKEEDYQHTTRRDDLECYFHYTNADIPMWAPIVPGSHVTTMLTLSAAQAQSMTGVPQKPTRVCHICSFKAMKSFKPATPPVVDSNLARTPPVIGGADDYITGMGATCIGCGLLNP